MPRLLLFEKNVFMQDALRSMLEGRFPDLIVRKVFSFEGCISELRDFKPDILLLDLSYHSGKDMQHLRQIRQQDFSTVIMLLMDYDIDEYRKEAILNGADYIISRDLWTGREIISLIHSILAAGNHRNRNVAESVPEVAGFGRIRGEQKVKPLRKEE